MITKYTISNQLLVIRYIDTLLLYRHGVYLYMYINNVWRFKTYRYYYIEYGMQMITKSTFGIIKNNEKKYHQ